MSWSLMFVHCLVSFSSRLCIDCLSPMSTPVSLADIAQTQTIGAIVDTEAARLEAEKIGLDAEKFTRERAAALNQSYARRMRQYAYLCGVLVGAAAIGAICVTIGSFFPSVIWDILTIVALAAGIIWSYYIYLDILGRDDAEFDQVSERKLIDPAAMIQTTRASDISAGKTGSGAPLTGAVSACVGSDCCDPAVGTVWSSTEMRCVPKVASSITGSTIQPFTMPRQVRGPSPLAPTALPFTRAFT